MIIHDSSIFGAKQKVLWLPLLRLTLEKLQSETQIAEIYTASLWKTPRRGDTEVVCWSNAVAGWGEGSWT